MEQSFYSFLWLVFEDAVRLVLELLDFVLERKKNINKWNCKRQQKDLPTAFNQRMRTGCSLGGMRFSSVMTLSKMFPTTYVTESCLLEDFFLNQIVKKKQQFSCRVEIIR